MGRKDLAKVVVMGGLVLLLVGLPLLGGCAKPAPTPAVTPTPTPTTTPKPAPTATATPTPTPAPAPKPTPIPTPSPTLSKVGWPTSLGFGTQSIGSSTYIMTAALGTMVTKYLGLPVTVEPAGGSEAMARLMDAKKLDVCSLSGDALYDAPRGNSPYEHKINMRLLYPAIMQSYYLVARTDSGIKTPEDLRGKKLMTNMGSFILKTTAELLIQSAGLKKDTDVKLLTGTSMTSLVNALKDRTADAFWSIMNPTLGETPVKDLALTTDITVVPLGAKYQQAFSGVSPYLSPGEIVAGLYKGQDKPVPCILLPIGMAVRNELPESLLYEMMKLVFDRSEEFGKVHPLAAMLTKEFALTAVTEMPWHTQAVKYWKDKGLWTPELDKAQKRLLAEVGAAQ